MREHGPETSESSSAPPARVLAWGLRELDFRGFARAVIRASAEACAGDRLYWRLPSRSRGVALTFDDGPDPERTPEILEILRSYGARATFFVVGEAARKHPELVRRVVREGHAVGNHTDTHVHCPDLFPERFRHEVRACDATLRSICPELTEIPFRPPFGAIAPRQLWQMLRERRRVVLWNRDSRDYRSAAAEAIAAMGGTLRPRDLLLMHDRFPAAAEALPELLERLRQRGLATIALNDPLLARHHARPPDDPLMLKTVTGQVDGMRRKRAGSG